MTGVYQALNCALERVGLPPLPSELVGELLRFDDVLLSKGEGLGAWPAAQPRNSYINWLKDSITYERKKRLALPSADDAIRKTVATHNLWHSVMRARAGYELVDLLYPDDAAEDASEDCSNWLRPEVGDVEFRMGRNVPDDCASYVND